MDKINDELNWDQFKKDHIAKRLKVKKEIRKQLNDIAFIREIGSDRNIIIIKYSDDQKDYLIKTIEYLIYNNLSFKVELNDLIFDLYNLSTIDIASLIDFLKYSILNK
jgi:hypothetical protein